MKPWNDTNKLYEEYVEKQRSTSAIAKEWGTYPITIRRALIKSGIPVRDKSQAQKINIEKNGPPMLGKKRSEEEKAKISSGLQKFWDDMTEEESEKQRERLSVLAKHQWANLSEEEREDAIKRMQTSSRTIGSRNENMLAEILSNAGYRIIQRTKDYTPGRRFEIDIAIRDERIAIEWDGVAHFLPIYGDEQLKKVKKKDTIKDKILTKAGWTVIRCRDNSTAPTLAVCRRVADKIIDIIESGKRGEVHIIYT